jgi:uncharacterized membrane protein HdeD (DUF308 family)
MTSLLTGIRSLFTGFIERSLLKEPQPGTTRSLYSGYVFVLLGCASLALIALLLAQYYLLQAALLVLVGLSVLVRGVADLVFERDRRLAIRLRVLSLIATVLAYAALLLYLLYVFRTLS